MLSPFPCDGVVSRVKNMSDFGAMNEVWSAWVDPENKPARACIEAPMAHPGILFEVMVTAVKKA
jgi:enamine deaminase RidA (YjgF/YER057c/UK114 family)